MSSGMSLKETIDKVSEFIEGNEEMTIELAESALDWLKKMKEFMDDADEELSEDE